ncbi:probable long-chain-alcohol O-fatty-acyltransferase 5 [Oryza brachyantha]|uniref:probable long-chain-alcohol O-fatty-acyltransferase 5 n=1 Tax=Oryza brachyantha TaxID=4533 RepID=UPI001ADBB595|nr:probable long-chain-alcohol O-fatty-acyltransferase 5 [Oryza brachyantha]XP_040379613.1 probable long-chain-alcohol O-fatty-acyltransferase 5 [Oryza brachyantha]
MAGGDLRSLTAVAAGVAAAMSYVRFAARRLRPGLPRLAAFVPVLAVLPVLPLAFRALHLRAVSGFFLAWLAEFKLLLLASGGQGPLDASLPLPAFVAVASLPVRQRRPAGSENAPRSGLGLVTSAVMAALLAAIVSLYRHGEKMNNYALLMLYSLHVYLSLELILAFTAAAARVVMGMDLEPQFDRPYLSASLREFWGRRWNLSVPALLRQCVSRPVRARVGGVGGVAAGVLAAFLVSGIMHEAIIYYATLRPPTGEATAFFALQGVCAVAEGWWAAHSGWPRPPRAVATTLTLAFILATGFWLIVPPITRTETDKVVIAETEAVVVFVRDAGSWAASSVRSFFTGRS